VGLSRRNNCSALTLKVTKISNNSFVTRGVVMENKMSDFTRIACGVLGALGILPMIVGAFNLINAGAELLEFIRYSLAAYAWFVFLYAAFTGKHLLRSSKKDANSNAT